jgi:hypothetical protein
MGNPRRATSLTEPGGGPIGTACAYEISRIGPPASAGAISDVQGELLGQTEADRPDRDGDSWESCRAGPRSGVLPWC